MYFVWEPSELKKSPYKMYERNPHTKCMRVVLSAEVKSAEAISKKSKIQEKSHASPRTTSSGAARAAPGAAALRKKNGEKEPPPPTPTRVERPRDWHDDPGEKGRRIWEWWRSRLLDEICPFVYFKEAVRLVVLVQTSSASIERVFSQVKRILASVGENILEDNLELRLLRRCCKKLEEMTSSWT